MSAFLTPDELHRLTGKREQDYREVCARALRIDEIRRKRWTPEPVELIIARAKPYDPERTWPRASGIYFLFDAGVLAYVGKSYCVGQRLEQHRDRGRIFDSYAYVACPQLRLRNAEFHYIKTAKPRDNVR